jgi:hypothetical protein
MGLKASAPQLSLSFHSSASAAACELLNSKTKVFDLGLLLAEIVVVCVVHFLE